ncbi:putative zinc-type alcohol dehydrogenase-like protein [Labedella gwakjiensis]|uniref:alcohol dehydrogenase (NADP(+)) n=1 Tax=Labedella gwakjiensis TaxID=390269 RepID=A0A2P8GUD1_9MICO|nr:NAD(P)-dependent alcohol dehydrogenase [Labedella gwakjiensis]PSL37566.1 putative zinc-type alcohol dehydrogenase-like protein [Labedella gwakjiensis]RUQ84866.1 NAD(P)-dependent alcohol dehydrogenase [Labedella gwakjiensis]
MRSARALGTTEQGATPTVRDIERRDLRPDDVAVRVTFSGVCHSDLHAVDSHTDGSLLVPGHEFVGEVTAVGADVTGFAVGDPVAVGNIVDSCGACDMCLAGQENFCREFPTLTYGGRDRRDGSTTLGGYSTEYVVREGFVYHRPASLDAAGVAPLMCAGATVWEPLRRWNVGPGVRVGVVGLGGLGHLAVKLAAALGADVTVFTTSAGKEADARALGARDVVVSTDESAMTAVAARFDVIFDTVAVPHELAPYLRTVALDGTLCVLGYLGSLPVNMLDLALGHKSVSSGGSAGRPHTQELLDFCGEHGITADVEVLPSRDVATAFDRLRRNDVRYRFVLDLADLAD